MAGSPFHLIAVGKLKHQYLEQGCELYLERLRHTRTVEMRIIKDADSSLSLEARKKQEGARILKALAKSDYPIFLDEAGCMMSSLTLAELIKRFDEENQTPCFILGGPFGFDQETKALAKMSLSLSKMTLPHELARLILLEQLYRSETILHGLPYHH